MAQPNNPKTETTKSKPYVSKNIKHRTVTLNGSHNKNKALYRLGVTADEINRAKALLTMGGTEDTFQNTLNYCSYNHHPVRSQSFSRRPDKKHSTMVPTKKDPLEHEYTLNSQTQDTISQSLEKRESNSVSVTWTHSHTNNPKGNKSKSKSSHSSVTSKSKRDSLKLMNELSMETESESENILINKYINDSDHSSDNDTHNIKYNKYIKQNPHISHTNKRSYANDDICTNIANINGSKIVFQKRKSDSFFLNNHKNGNTALMTRIPHNHSRKYQSKNVRKNSAKNSKKYTINITHNSNNNNTKPSQTTPKDWFQFDDSNDMRNGYESRRNPKKVRNQHKSTENSDNNASAFGFEFDTQKTKNPYAHPTKNVSVSTPKKSKKSEIHLSNDFEEEKAHKKRKKSSKSKKSLRKPKTKTPTKADKKSERDRWKQNRENRRFHSDKSDVINTSAKVLDFFGDNPRENKKLNWKLGATMDNLMDLRSEDIVKITEIDDNIRKKQKKQFTRKAKFIRKISQIKLKLAGKSFNKDSANDIESKNFLSNSSFSDVDNDTFDGNESGASTQSAQTNTDIECENVTDSVVITVTSTEEKKESMPKRQSKHMKSATPINGIRLNKNGGYHIDQKMFTFQDPNINIIKHSGSHKQSKSRHKRNLGVYSKSRSPSPGNGDGNSRFYRKKKKKANHLSGQYGFGPKGRPDMKKVNNQIKGLRKLLAAKKTLGEIIGIYYTKYQFCLEFIVTLIATIDLSCPQYIMVVSRHVDKQIKILHNLSLWQYIVRHQLGWIEIERFFYSFGPLIGKYKTLISPLHLAARKLIEVGGGKETHITANMSTECRYALANFKLLLWIGYDIDDGDIDNTITPQTILKHVPRILKQILKEQRQFLFRQREVMKSVDNCAYKQYKILLDDDILHVIEKFTYCKYRKSGFGHKKFVKT